MQTTNFSEAVDGLLESIGNTGIGRVRIILSESTGVYHCGEPEMPGESEFVLENRNCRTVMDLDYMECKVWVKMIKLILAKEVKIGDSKENSQDGEQSGDHDSGSCSGESESETGGLRGDGKFPRSDGDTGGNDERNASANQSRQDNAARPVDEPTPEDCEH